MKSCLMNINDRGVDSIIDGLRPRISSVRLKISRGRSFELHKGFLSSTGIYPS